MKTITEKLLETISDWKDGFSGAYSIREDGKCAEFRSTDTIRIEPKQDLPGLDIHVAPGTKGETVSIPACVTQGDIDDLVYNDFYIGEGADIIISAGCGVHNDSGEPARHNGIHRFFLAKNSHVLYREKHIGTGGGDGKRSIDPVTSIFLEEGAVMEMDTSQIGGLDDSNRKTNAELAAGSRLTIRERLLTEGNQQAHTDFEVSINGDGAGVDLISRSVARGDSHQSYRSHIIGNAKCTGHSECDAIIPENGTVSAAPELDARNQDASLIHEAAIGKIAGEQLLKLKTLGLTETEAEAKIVEGFLR